MKNLFVLFLIIFLSGCSFLKFPFFSSPKEPDKHYNWNERIVTKPRCVQIGDACYPVVYETIKELDVRYEQKDKPLTFLQKIGNWISSLTLVSFIVIVIGLAFGTGAPLMWFWNRYVNIRRAFTETVKGIKDSGKVDQDPELHNALASAQSDKTKRIVDDVRRTI